SRKPSKESLIKPRARSGRAAAARRRAQPSKSRARTRSIVHPSWQYKGRIRPGSAAESHLVNQHIPLVRNVVGRLAMTLPPHVDGEDLFSAGLSGLLSAVRKYDPTAGTSFETYARLRIRGAVFDELRRMDWVPRSVHTKARKVQRVMQEI